VPAVPPTDFGPMPVNLVGGGTKQASSAYPWLVKYNNVPLVSQAENPNKTFSTDVGGVNVLTNMLLPRVSDATPLESTYAITVTGSYPISQANYILDRDAGRIMIFDGPVNSGSVTPTISFWRYEGTTLADGGGGGGGITSVTAGTSDNLVVNTTAGAVTVDLADNVTIGEAGSLSINSGNMLMVAQAPKGAILLYENTAEQVIGGLAMSPSGTVELAGVNVQLSTAAANTTQNPRLYINTIGNVGIGTVAPAVKLDVAGRTNITLNGGDSALVATNTDLSGAALKCEMSGANLLVTKDASSNTVVKNTSGTGLVFGTGNSGFERMRITAAGNVGIGTTAPTAALDVSGTSWTSGNIVINRTTTGTDTTMHQLQFLRGRSGTTLLAGDELGRINFLPKDANGIPNFAAVSLRAFAEGNAIGSVCPSYFSISTVPSATESTDYERLRITAAGNVGIGTSAPTARLDVLTEERITKSGDATKYLMLQQLNDNNSYVRTVGGGHLNLGTGATNSLIINSNGNVGIGTSTPTATLDISGDLRVTGNTYFPLSYYTNFPLEQKVVLFNYTGTLVGLYLNQSTIIDQDAFNRVTTLNPCKLLLQAVLPFKYIEIKVSGKLGRYLTGTRDNFIYCWINQNAAITNEDTQFAIIGATTNGDPSIINATTRITYATSDISGTPQRIVSTCYNVAAVYSGSGATNITLNKGLTPESAPGGMNSFYFFQRNQNNASPTYESTNVTIQITAVIP
jgi:hypothetical protein